MKKNKKLKKELLLYKREIILRINDYILNKKNKEEINNLIGDISLTNEILEVSIKINYIKNTIVQILEFPMCSEFISLSNIKEYIETNKYYEELLNEILKRKFKGKVLKSQLNLK